MKNDREQYAWVAKIGTKGQFVIPAEAREVFGFKPGDTILLLGDKSKGIAIVKKEDFAQFFDAVIGGKKWRMLLL